MGSLSGVDSKCIEVLESNPKICNKCEIRFGYFRRSNGSCVKVPGIE